MIVQCMSDAHSIWNDQPSIFVSDTSQHRIGKMKIDLTKIWGLVCGINHLGIDLDTLCTILIAVYLKCFGFRSRRKLIIELCDSGIQSLMRYLYFLCSQAIYSIVLGCLESLCSRCIHWLTNKTNTCQQGLRPCYSQNTCTSQSQQCRNSSCRYG